MNTTHRHSIVLFFLIFGIISVGSYWFFSHKTPATQSFVDVEHTTEGGENVDVSFYEDRIKNATIVVPETQIQISLVDGRASYGTNLDGGDVSFVKLLGGFTSNGVVHVFADLVVQSGGTGSFHYITLFDIDKEKVTHRSSYFVGDRIVLQSATTSPTSLSTYSVTLQYLDRKVTDAMVDDPTVEVFRVLPVKNGMFVQSDL